MAKNRNQDAVKGWATAGVPGAVAGYFGLLPGSGLDDGQEEERKRLETIKRAQDQLGYMQALGTRQRSSVIGNIGQMYAPANDRLARLYGQGARVQMPIASTPLEKMYSRQRGPGGR